MEERRRRGGEGEMNRISRLGFAEVGGRRRGIADTVEREGKGDRRVREAERGSPTESLGMDE
jgi:hypothetical protein